MFRLAGAFSLLSLAVALALAPAADVALAASSGGGSSSTSSSSTPSGGSGDLAAAQAKVDDKNYRGAIALLEGILAEQPSNADALNLLGYSHRMLGNKDKALAYYGEALKLNPKHVGANEYLGELYLEMKDLPKAEERLSVLSSACSNCAEYNELKEKIAAFKAQSS